MKIATCLFLLLLAGCQATSFQTPPLAAETDCDPELVGRWVSVTDAGQANDELRLDIDAACALAVADFDKGQLREGESTTLRVGRDATGRYAWVTAGWADRRFDAKDLQTDPADIYLFRYRIEGSELVVQTVDHKAVAHRIIDAGIPGTVRSDDRVLANRITGRARPELLTLPDLFEAEPMRFRRPPEGR
jgi:hypothetical protein